jgi:hypothetical protein
MSEKERERLLDSNDEKKSHRLHHFLTPKWFFYAHRFHEMKKA